MNSFDALKLLGAPAPERETEERAREAERWAALLAQALPQALSQRFGTLDESREESPDWQGSVGVLTPEANLTGVGIAPESSGAGETQSVVLSLRAGDLGELKCLLDRSESGVRVVIGVDGRDAMTAAGAERGALEAALRSAGLCVQSVSVVSMARFGTVLARGNTGPNGRSVQQGPAAGRETRSRRVKLIG
jgi:hypothetical protein